MYANANSYICLSTGAGAVQQHTSRFLAHFYCLDLKGIVKCPLIKPSLDRQLSTFRGSICGTLYPHNLQWIKPGSL